MSNRLRRENEEHSTITVEFGPPGTRTPGRAYGQPHMRTSSGAGPGVGSKIAYDPKQSNLNLQNLDDPTLKFGGDQPGVVPLGHELIHGHRNAKGMSQTHPFPDEYEVGGLNNRTNAALPATGKDTPSVTDNQLRKELNEATDGPDLPLRTEYHINK